MWQIAGLDGGLADTAGAVATITIIAMVTTDSVTAADTAAAAAADPVFAAAALSPGVAAIVAVARLVHIHGRPPRCCRLRS